MLAESFSHFPREGLDTHRSEQKISTYGAAANNLHMSDGVRTSEVIAGDVFFEIIDPPELEYTYRLRPAKDFGGSFGTTFKSARGKLVPAIPADACSTKFENLDDLVGNIALVERGSLEDGHFEYNFTELDTFLDYLKHFGLHPAFELMGVPLGELGMATVLSERFWKDLMQQLAGHYLSRFGVEYIAQWRFETWNEPDLKNYNMLNFSVDDVRYAAILFSIVAQHWDAMADTADPVGQQFRFLSHDNAFLSYHPYEFEQRTLLARFQMNETEPPHVQFVTKPVYSALGMLAMLGPRATRTRFREGNVSYIVSFDERSPPSYFCLLASRSNDSHPLTVRRSQFNVTIPLHMFWNQSLGVDSSTSSAGARVSYLIEAIQDGLNDPFRVWQWQGRPAYPTINQLAAMRAVQFPTVLNKGGIAETVQMGGNRNAVELSLSLRGPWIVSVRICSNAAKPGPVQRIVQVSTDITKCVPLICFTNLPHSQQLLVM
uniref:Glycosyl hydrolases family 39 N-terminal catalytic domain-containing protein n=1 Tax=Anopheles atroparvus TaxID=41427 RepID=A0A182JDP4_ANOAO